MPRSPANHAQYMRETWYPANRAKHKAYVRRNERRLKALIDAEKERRGGCETCGFNGHSAALDFHHRDGELKLFNIAQARNRGFGRASIIAEMAKCDLLCANCHRIHHAEETE